MNIKKAASELGLKESTIRTLVRQGKVVAGRNGKKSWDISDEEIVRVRSIQESGGRLEKVAEDQRLRAKRPKTRTIRARNAESRWDRFSLDEIYELWNGTSARSQLRKELGKQVAGRVMKTE